MRILMIVVIAVGLSGCGAAPPTLAGGKPVGAWVEALQSRDAKLRQKAALKLGNVGPADPAVLPALVRALKDTDAGVRCEVILALMKFGPGVNESIADLTLIRQQDPDAKVRRYASRALEQLGDGP